MCEFIVSIQLLFLFNSQLDETDKKIVTFQYSFCSSVPVQLESCDCFNTASVLIQRELLQSFPGHSWFQYSFCSYSTSPICSPRSSNPCFNTASVLIQQHCPAKHIKSRYCFNTASVLIQLSINFLKKYFSEFQYSFCSYSTYLHCNVNHKQNSFNTASVLIQRLKTEQRVEHIICFNTASVLIQLEQC